MTLSALKIFLDESKRRSKAEHVFGVVKNLFKFRTTEQMQPSFQILIERGYIREEERKTGGRPTKKPLVNPLALKDRSP